ncbi:MAG TPA: TetR/AcrR family transcriptional regulator [Myxococcota bacterium]|nr:TetR/AcrR family transcriptional regulator [Myxococcota bacterium]
MSAIAQQNGAVETRRERRKREVHDRIARAATALFERQGFSDTTALEIADAADVAEKTFYNHFPTKQHLIEELARASLVRLMHLLENARRGGGTPRERLLRFFEGAADEAEGGSRPLARELILEWVRVSQVDHPEDRRLHEAFAALFAGGGDARERDFLADMAVATYTGILINWVSRSDYPLRERLLAAARLLCGAAAKKESR